MTKQIFAYAALMLAVASPLHADLTATKVACTTALGSKKKVRVEDPVTAEELHRQDLRELEVLIGYATINRRDLSARLKYVKRSFNALGIKYRESRWWQEDEIYLEPSGTARLNVMAGDMLRNHGVEICYNPARVSFLAIGTKAAYHFGQKKVWLSDVVALFGRPDRALFHEFKHVVTSQNKTKLAKLFSGVSRRLWFNFSEKGLAKSAYDRWMYQDEALTWAYERQLTRRAARALAAQPYVSDLEFEKMERAFATSTNDVYQDLIRLNSDLTPFKAILWNSVSGRGNLFVSRYHCKGRFDRDQIPEDMVKAALPPTVGPSPRARRAFFNSREGRRLARSLHAQLRANRRAFLEQQQKEFVRDRQASGFPGLWLYWYAQTDELRSKVHRALLADTFAPDRSRNTLSPLWAEMPVPQTEDFGPEHIDFSKCEINTERTFKTHAPEGISAEAFKKILSPLTDRSVRYGLLHLTFGGPKGPRTLDIEVAKEVFTFDPPDYSALTRLEGLTLVSAEFTGTNSVIDNDLPLNFFAVRNRVRLSRFLVGSESATAD